MCALAPPYAWCAMKKVDLPEPLSQMCHRKGDRPMRAADCPLCGEHLEAENDDELFKKGRAHVDDKHGDQQITDDQIRQVPTHDA
jgi:predicted small metal-binding protein